jgi:tryptophan synthase alpha subunit
VAAAAVGRELQHQEQVAQVLQTKDMPVEHHQELAQKLPQVAVAQVLLVTPTQEAPLVMAAQVLHQLSQVRQ